MVSSYNGWVASKDAGSIDIDPDFTAAGRKFPGGVKRGPVSVVLRYVAEQFDRRVEELDHYKDGDEWGYHFKQSANSPSLVSCHSSGTALDLNATRHPNGTAASKTFTREQIAEIKKILQEVDGVVRWLGEARVPDPMHFEIAASEAAVARVAGRLLQPVPDEPLEDDMPGPAIVRDAKDRRILFDRGPDGALWWQVESDGWKATALKDRLGSAPSAELTENGVVEIAAYGADGKTSFVCTWNGAVFSPWMPTGVKG